MHIVYILVPREFFSRGPHLQALIHSFLKSQYLKLLLLSCSRFRHSPLSLTISKLQYILPLHMVVCTTLDDRGGMCSQVSWSGLKIRKLGIFRVKHLIYWSRLNKQLRAYDPTRRDALYFESCDHHTGWTVSNQVNCSFLEWSWPKHMWKCVWCTVRAWWGKVCPPMPFRVSVLKKQLIYR